MTPAERALIDAAMGIVDWSWSVQTDYRQYRMGWAMTDESFRPFFDAVDGLRKERVKARRAAADRA